MSELTRSLIEYKIIVALPVLGIALLVYGSLFLNTLYKALKRIIKERRKGK